MNAIITVVGVALVRDGLVLAARRRTGGWEFPGGKVEPGESEAAAGVRECREELAVEVALTHALPGAEVCGPHHVLKVWAGSITSGEPENLEHAELRWVDAAGLAALDLLPPDRPFVPAVAGLL